MSADPLPVKQNPRRNFLRVGLTATVAAAVYPALSSARAEDAAAAVAPTPDAKKFAADFELDEITIDDVQKGFQSGQ